MPLAQGMEQREPPSECVAAGMETHPAAGTLPPVESLSSLLFHLCWKPSHHVTLIPGCGSMGTTGDRRGSSNVWFGRISFMLLIPIGKSAMVLTSYFILADYLAYRKLNFIASKLRIET